MFKVKINKKKHLLILLASVVLIIAFVAGNILLINKMFNRDNFNLEEFTTLSKPKTKRNQPKSIKRESNKQIPADWFGYQNQKTGLFFGYPRQLKHEDFGSDQRSDLYIPRETEHHLTIQKIYYDQPSNNDLSIYQSYNFSGQAYQQLSQDPSCEQLSDLLNSQNKNNRNFLPASFKKPNLCDYIHQGQTIIFYVIGLRNDVKTEFFLESDILVLGSGHAALISNVLSHVNQTPAAVKQYEEKHPEIGYQTNEWEELNQIKQNSLKSLIKNPDSELNQKFDLLKQVAQTIEFTE
ncbi:MAG: hypothetical protein GF335_02400 [Candidatus Moranbacteria bacterium]|nr:hypothetical protein [Candidatus Moranbacteria bacterium]